MNWHIVKIIVAFSFLGLSPCKAQNIGSQDGKTIKAIKETYSVSINPKGDQINVSNTGNVFPLSGMRPPNKAPMPDPKDSNIDEAEIKAVIRNVFTTQRLREIAQDTKRMLINFKTDSHGELKDVNFAISPSTTSITATEIEKLEQQLKTTVHVTINQSIYKGYNYVVISRFVIFERLINNEPNAVH